MKDFKVRLDKQSICDIENMAKVTQLGAKRMINEFYGVLWYLEYSRRFKENPLYRDSDFAKYLSSEYGIKLHLYQKQRLALQTFPEFCEKYSPELCVKIKGKCINPSQVIKEIDSVAAKRKTPLRLEEVNTIIDKHKIPREPKPARPSVKVLRNEIIFEQEEARSLRKLISEKDGQIERLKAALKKLKAKNEKLEEENMKLQQEVDSEFVETDVRGCPGAAHAMSPA